MKIKTNNNNNTAGTYSDYMCNGFHFIDHTSASFRPDSKVRISLYMYCAINSPTERQCSAVAFSCMVRFHPQTQTVDPSCTVYHKKVLLRSFHIIFEIIISDFRISFSLCVDVVRPRIVVVTCLMLYTILGSWSSEMFWS